MDHPYIAAKIKDRPFSSLVAFFREDKLQEYHFQSLKPACKHVFSGCHHLSLSFYPHPPLFHVLVPRLTRAVRRYEYGVFVFSNPVKAIFDTLCR